ncbi:MAG TPA: hypothetical protein EYO33_06750 [Phycisphaerales bacterium]|nr:hypothetical protein [Phycisphaerales bacterium]
MPLRVRADTLTIQIEREKDASQARTRIPGAEQRYRLTPVAGGQPRLQNRLDIVPLINLDGYDFYGVIDFLELEVTTPRLWAPRNLSTHLKKEGAGTQGVRACPQPGETTLRASRFSVMLNEPTKETLRQALDVFAKLETVDCGGLITVLEVSIDIYPKKREDEAARATMTDLLRRHAFPKETIWRRPGGWPRWVGNAKSTTTGQTSATHFLFGNGKVAPTQRLSRDGLNKKELTPANATTYFGPRDVPVPFVRIMDKVIDNQNRPKGSRDELDVTSRRSRIEVLLRGDALVEFMGTPHVDHLGEVDFQKLRSTYFRFAIPTLPGHSTPALAAASNNEVRKMDLAAFAVGGVVGVQLLQAHRRTRLHQHRKQRNKERTEKKDYDRNGGGEWGYLSSHKDMDRKIQNALEKINRTWGRWGDA